MSSDKMKVPDDRDKYDVYYSDFDRGYIGEQYNNENQSTKALLSFMQESISEDASVSILDAGCGDGAMLASAGRRFRNAKLAGFDIARAMIEYAREQHPKEVRIGKGDILDITSFSKEKFDVIYTVHTICLFPNFETPVRSLMNSARKHVFINSLFSPQNIDMYANVDEPGMPAVPWNIFSVKRFTEFVMLEGAKDVVFREFEMPFELEKPEEGMGSYTRQLNDGRFLTFSGPLFLPWYLVRIDL